MSAATQPAGALGDAPVKLSAPDAVAPPPGNPRFPLMDALRALAALGVVGSHVAIFTLNAQRHAYGALLANLDIGVPVFFVLSGFLLYRPFFRAQLHGLPAPKPSAYARRRILRIVPAYWLALTVLAIYPGVPGVFSGDWWRYYGFLQFYSYHSSIRGLGVAWTLCVEVAFYVALPFYAALLRRVSRRLRPAGQVRVQLALLAVLSIASIAARAGDQGVVMQNSLLSHFYWFAVGMALAVASVAVTAARHSPSPVRRIAAHPAGCWLGAGAVYLIMCALLTSAPGHLYYSVAQSFWQYLLSGVFAGLLVLPAVFGQEAGGWPRRLLAWRWLAWLGVISYGIYLWHATIAITLIRHDLQSWLPLIVADLAVTIAVAAASYHVLERPILRLKDRRTSGSA